MNLSVYYRLLAPRATLLGSTGDALENTIVDSYKSGTLCWVTAEATLYYLDKLSVLTPDPPNVIATSRGAGVPGRWIIASGGGGSTGPTGPAGGGGSEKAISLLEGLPYVLSTDFNVLPVLELTLDNVVEGDQIVLTCYAEIQNNAAATREVHAEQLVNGTIFQSSDATAFAATGTVGDIGPMTMSIAFPAAAPDTGSVTYAFRLYASGVDVTAPQVFFSAKNLGQ